jgi:hypothetical protein
MEIQKTLVRLGFPQPATTSFARSEQKLQGKLNLPWSVGSRHRCNLAEIVVSEIRLWPVEYRMVRHIERLGTELQIVVLRNLENLVEREIDHVLVRPITDIAWRIAQIEILPASQMRWDRATGRGTESRSRHPDILTEQAGTLSGKADDAADRILVRNRERQSGLPDRAGVDLPSAQDQPGGAPFSDFPKGSS